MKTSHLKNFIFFAPKVPPISLNTLNGCLQRFWLAACLSLFTLMLLACGQEGADTGGYRADLVFPENIPRIAGTSDIDCAATDIKNIVFNFIADGKQYGPSSFDCEEHRAVITEVPAGENVTVEVFADDSNYNAILEGLDQIHIPKDKVVTGGKIQMRYVSSEPGTDTEDADFSGIWKIKENPEGCAPFVGMAEFTSEIDQTGKSATIFTTTIESVPVNASCTVNGNELSCLPFEFKDAAGWTHSYSKYIIIYIDHNHLYGNSNWVLYDPNDREFCSGTLTSSAARMENADDIEE